MTRGLEILSSKFLMINEKGITNWWSSQNINTVINVLFNKSIKLCTSVDRLIYEVAIKKPRTTGRNLRGPSITSTTVLSILVDVLLTTLLSLLIINLAKSLLKT